MCFFLSTQGLSTAKRITRGAANGILFVGYGAVLVIGWGLVAYGVYLGFLLTFGSSLEKAGEFGVWLFIVLCVAGLIGACCALDKHGNL